MQQHARSALRHSCRLCGVLAFALVLGFATDWAIGQGINRASSGSSGAALTSVRPSAGGSIGSVSRMSGVGGQAGGSGSQATGARGLSSGGVTQLGAGMRSRGSRRRSSMPGRMGGLGSPQLQGPAARSARSGGLLGRRVGLRTQLGGDASFFGSPTRSSPSAFSLAYRAWKRPGFLGITKSEIVRFHSTRYTRMAEAARRASDVNPEVVVPSDAKDRILDSALVVSGEARDEKAEVSFRQLVEDHVASRCWSSLNDGWAHFKAGRYRKACDTFALADRLALDDVSARSQAKWGRLFSAVGCRQLALAAYELRWFTLSDPATGGMRDPMCMSRITEMRSRYGRVGDFEEHFRLLQLRIEQDPDSVEYRALSAVYLWTSEETRSQARFAVSQSARLGKDAKVMERLAKMMELSDRMQPLKRESGEAGLTIPIASESDGPQ